MKKLVPIFMVLALITIGAGCQTTTTNTQSDSRVRIVASFYPLAYFAEKVGGDAAVVDSITPAGIEPHDFEPTPKQGILIRQADLFLFQGKGLDPWAERMQKDVETEGVRVIHMSEQLENERGDEYGRTDPHSWLDPVLVMQQVEIIRDTLIELDPENQLAYAENARLFLMELQELDYAFTQGLASCRLDEIVVSHNAFGYLAHRYQFETIPISGISPTDEPSPKQLADITTLVQQYGIQYIFFETLVSPRLAETVAQEINIQTLVLNPVEGLTEEQIASGETYVSVMQKNLEHLRLAMECM